MEFVFEKLAEQTIKEIQNLPVDSECQVYKRRKIQQASNSMEDNKYEKIFFRLQLRKNFVVLLTPEEKEIVSGFVCDISVTFKLIRSNTIDTDQVGELLGIQFRSETFSKKSIFMYIPEDNKSINTESLQKFSLLLSGKYILQDGFHEIFRAIKKIGKGVTASVYKALRLTDKKQVAVKSFKKDVYYAIDNGRGKVVAGLNQFAFEKEFKAMTQIDSKYVCKLIGVYESGNSIYIVMELLTRSLYSFLKINGLPSLNSSKQIMVKLMIGISELHRKNIMHRDLKLQNIMVLEVDSLIEPIIIDLGLAELSTNAQFLYTKCGTPGYVAPEILNLKSNQIPNPPYNQLCDIFSMGVIFYILLAGKTLFEGVDERDVVRKNKECDIDYEFKNQAKFTEEMKELLGIMLQKDPTKRSSAEQLLKHKFFSEVQFLKQFQTRNTSTLMQLSQEKQKEQMQKV